MSDPNPQVRAATVFEAWTQFPSELQDATFDDPDPEVRGVIHGFHWASLTPDHRARLLADPDEDLREFAEQSAKKDFRNAIAAGLGLTDDQRNEAFKDPELRAAVASSRWSELTETQRSDVLRNFHFSSPILQNKAIELSKADLDVAIRAPLWLVPHMVVACRWTVLSADQQQFALDHPDHEVRAAIIDSAWDHLDEHQRSQLRNDPEDYIRGLANGK